jgi:hypothetical protein
MSLTPSLRNRVKRLEVAASIRAEPTLTELLREVEARRGVRRSMTAEQREAQAAAYRAACIASLDAPDAPVGSVRAALLDVSRRIGRRCLADHASAAEFPSTAERSAA